MYIISPAHSSPVNQLSCTPALLLISSPTYQLSWTLALLHISYPVQCTSALLHIRSLVHQLSLHISSLVHQLSWTSALLVHQLSRTSALLVHQLSYSSALPVHQLSCKSALRLVEKYLIQYSPALSLPRDTEGSCLTSQTQSFIILFSVKNIFHDFCNISFKF